MSTDYPRDEFDDVPSDGPQGVHRKPKSPWKTVLPFLLVLLVVPLLAWGATELIRGAEKDKVVVVEDEVTQSEDEPQSQAEAIAPLPEEGPTGLPDDEEAPVVEAPVEEAPAAEIHYDAAVVVLNASGISGLAGTNTDTLIEAGFVNAWAGNADSSSTPENTVYYQSPDYYATAVKVGELLGIGNLVENADAVGSSQIAVLLRTQP